MNAGRTSRPAAGSTAAIFAGVPGIAWGDVASRLLAGAGNLAGAVEFATTSCRFPRAVGMAALAPEAVP